MNSGRYDVTNMLVVLSDRVRGHLKRLNCDGTSERIATVGAPMFSRVDVKHDMVVAEHC